MADREMTDFLDGVIGVVEATSFERSALWRECKGHKIKWRESLSGLGETVGHLADMPVHISLLVEEIDGLRILFWHATSQVVDYRMIWAWMNKHLPATAIRPDGHVNKTDATNFHNVFPRKAA